MRSRTSPAPVDGDPVHAAPAAAPVGASLELATPVAEIAANHASEAILVTDAEGRVVWANAAFEAMTALDRRTVLGGDVRAIWATRYDGPTALKSLGDAIVQGEGRRVQLSALPSADAAARIDLRVAPVRDERGEIAHFVVVKRDSTQEHQQQERARDLAAYQDAVDRQAIVSVADRKGHILFVNENFCRISGYDREELVGQTHSLINSRYHPGAFFTDMWRTILAGELWRGEVRNQRKDGGYYWVDTTIVPVQGRDGRPERYVSIRYDVTERKLAQENLRRLAERDVLTELCNRKVLLERLGANLQSTRAAPSEGALILIDMDHFKEINDTLGHDVGDEVLKHVAARLMRLTRGFDTVARLGGDEFAIILPQLRSAESIAAVIDRLQCELSAPIKIHETRVEPSFSIGVARFPEDGADATTLMKNADIALYEAKRNGRSQWRFYDRTVGEALAARQIVITKLRDAIDADELTVALQPQIALANGRLRGFEALVRWRCEGAFMSPAHFIPIAEEAGLIGRLGAVVLDKALRAFTEIRQAGFDPGVISINVSPPQLRAAEFVDLVGERLQAYGVDGADLELELTETALIGPWSDRVRMTLDALRGMGCTVALDDFGTGYSSLSYLKKFPVDTLKIDRSFVRDLDEDPVSAQLVRALLSFARELGLRTVAEGVETPRQEAHLRGDGCEFGQGYFYSKPVFLDQAVAFLAARAAGRDQAPY